MKLGVLLSPLAQPDHAHALRDQAREYESLGYSGIWSAQAAGRGFMMTDPLLALATAAAVTETIRLGTAVLQLPLYNPLALAHSVFSLQQLCGDRLILGVGAGSTAADFQVFGQDYDDRFGRFNRSASTLKHILASGSQGDANLTPWQAVIGGPPLYLGSWGNQVITAAERFDGWIASAHYRSVEDIALAAERYHRAGGKHAIVSTIQLSQQTDLSELKDRLQRFEEIGFEEAVVMFLPGGPDPARIIKLLDA